MTNKIYLSFNRLYTLKDGDYHGATLTYRIKHGDDLLAEGEIKGKSLSQFIRPIDIEEMEITKPLTVEYVCTGNVEDVSVSLATATDKPFRVVDGGFYIKDCFIRNGLLSDCKKRFTGSETMPFSGFPGTKQCHVQEASSNAQSILNNALATYVSSLSVGVNTASKSAEEQRIKNLVNEAVVEKIWKMLQPGGLLHRK
ncbi:hypothetical protein [Rahnella sp. ChDrAdgB13]|uniref:hypothetical protein n=1 Tax=Rahnella sp. ChDrAdgB13 TaxID=1850581 RepID=UPI001AD88C81|nr:hypothetical protein [Rahnella sp. ChDrAdgB13]